MWNKYRRKFVWSIGAAGFLLWAAAYGAYSGSQFGVVAVPNFLAAVKFTDVLLVIFSGLLYLATMATVEANRAMGKVAQRQEQHFKQSERAYVKLSHLSPPDVPAPALDPGREPPVVVQVKNWGDTPATVTEMLLTYVLVPAGQEPPPPPHVYVTPHARLFAGGFLVKDDHFNLAPALALTDGERANVDNGRLRLWLCGYVDYVDVFGQHHRAGYGRVYTPAIRGNNLVYEPSPYNYDQRRDVAS